MAAPSSRPPSKPYDLEITIVSAKHLKNVNWRHGDLKPYVIFWVDPEHRLATKSDDSGNTRPVWNERFVLHLPKSPLDTLLTLEIFHSKPSETPKPLVGTLRFQLKDLIDSDDSNKLRNFELRRPSGRPHGKIRLKLAVREAPGQDYQIPPPSSYYYSSAPPPPPPSYSTFPPIQPPPVVAPPPPPASPSPPPPHSYPYGGYSDPYSNYYPGYYSQPPPPPRPFVERSSSYGGLSSGPSAPLDYPPYDQKRSGKTGMGMGMGTGLAVGAVAGALGGLALGEGLKYEEDKIAGRVENNIAASRDDYSNYSVEY